MAVGLEVLASNILGVLQNLAPVISLILIILGGIMYGIAQTQPPDTRGKWQAAAISMVIGGAIVAAITGAAELIQSTSSQAITPV
jgi:hypothetical protein